MTTTYSVYLPKEKLILFMPESTEGVKEGQTTAMDYENEADSTENRAETVGK